jgi:diguanylate cyclase (GGDEF)-like protein
MYAAYPESERKRLRAIGALGLLDTPPEGEFDALAALAAEIIGCPIGLITVLAGDRQWVKAAFGTNLRETAREVAFCDHTVRRDGMFVVENAAEDERFASNPLVQGDPGTRFYAGMPIASIDPETGERVPIGAVCAIDTAPRQMSEKDERALAHLATLADALLRARTAATAAREVARVAETQTLEITRKERTLRQAERMAAMGSWRLCLDDDHVEWSEGVYRIYEMQPADAPDLTQALECFPPASRATITGALAKTMETGQSFDCEVDFITATGRQRRVRSIGELELRDGRAHAVVGTFQDVTDRHLIEESLRRSASVDETTRIANRAAFNTELELTTARARADGTSLSLLLVDLDRFKDINDRHGHLAGDDVLRAFGRRLRRAHPDGFAARLGGDEFGLILPGMSAEDAENVGQRLLSDLRMPVHSAAGVIPTSGTIGCAHLAGDVQSQREFIHRADVALYHAKRAKRGSMAVWGQLRTDDRRAA